MNQASKRTPHLWDWFWHGADMKHHRESLRSADPVRMAMIERARIAFQQAHRFENEPAEIDRRCRPYFPYSWHSQPKSFAPQTDPASMRR